MISGKGVLVTQAKFDIVSVPVVNYAEKQGLHTLLKGKEGSVYVLLKGAAKVAYKARCTFLGEGGVRRIWCINMLYVSSQSAADVALQGPEFQIVPASGYI